MLSVAKHLLYLIENRRKADPSLARNDMTGGFFQQPASLASRQFAVDCQLLTVDWSHGAGKSSDESIVKSLHQYSTFIRHSPCAGAVGPASVRSRASRMRTISPGSSLPRPSSMSVPTMLRTI